MAESIFTKIIRREIPADIVYEDDLVIAFRDISPKAPVHCLIVPKKEIATINDMQPEDEALVGHVVICAARIAKELGVDQSGYRLILNCNADAGQTVFHLHCHLLGGRELQWPPG